MRKSFRIGSAVAGALLLAACGGRTVKEGELSGELSLSGAFALYPLAVQWSEEFQALHPGVRIDISAGGAGKGMTDVLAGVVDLGMVSREVYPPEEERGAVGFAVAKDAVVPTINAANPKAEELFRHGLSREAAVKIWITGEAKTWGDVLGTDDRTPLHAYTRSDACGAAETWAMWLDGRQEDLVGTAVFGDPGVAAAVQKDIYGIGMNNIGYAYDNDTHRPNEGLLVLPVDADGDGEIGPDEQFCGTKEELIAAIQADRYPSPPARDLYLVANGHPTDPVLKAFLEYILVEGQKRNVPAGYIGLSAEKVEQELNRLRGAKEQRTDETEAVAADTADMADTTE
ncbi:MAG: PstS family phosphate ABC transporter substrate-binding protein [Rikenella sp.]|nr:PstS family phosphate ABC transporter substrate-binding protein [Rikenella sp.]